MGYYTSFYLTIRSKITKERAKQIISRLNEIMNWEAFKLDSYEYTPIDEIGWWDAFPNDTIKWYNWEENMTTLANEFPDVEFCIEGSGEDRDDWWIALFKGERKQIKYCSPPSDEWDD